jgi:hypothetical protein
LAQPNSHVKLVGSSPDKNPRETPPMAKKSRKKKARKNSKANHGKRPNS